MFQQGQYIRLLISTEANPTKVVAAAKQMNLHGTAQTEESSTKDTTGDYKDYDIVGGSYEITGSGLVLTESDPMMTNGVGLNDFETWLSDQVLYWRICIMTGTNNRTIVSEIASGLAKLTSLTANAPNRQNTTYNYTLTGYSDMTISNSNI